MVVIEDRRVFDRFMARFPVKFKFARNGFGRDIFLRDVCAQGAKLVTKRPTYINDQISVLVDLPDGHAPMSIDGKVIWVKGNGHRMWEVGVEFPKVHFMDTQRIFRCCQ